MLASQFHVWRFPIVTWLRISIHVSLSQFSMPFPTSVCPTAHNDSLCSPHGQSPDLALTYFSLPTFQSAHQSDGRVSSGGLLRLGSHQYPPAAVLLVQNHALRVSRFISVLKVAGSIPTRGGGLSSVEKFFATHADLLEVCIALYWQSRRSTVGVVITALTQ